MRMGISLDQYRARIGGFKQPGMLLFTRRRRPDIWEDILMVVERIGKEGRKLLIPLVNVFIGIRQIRQLHLFLSNKDSAISTDPLELIRGKGRVCSFPNEASVKSEVLRDEILPI